jgi:hypothetical protein
MPKQSGDKRIIAISFRTSELAVKLKTLLAYRLIRLLNGVVEAEVVRLIICLNPSHPFTCLLVKIDAFYSRCVISPESSVPLILSPRGQPEILQPVIAPDAVDVLYHLAARVLFVCQ